MVFSEPAFLLASAFVQFHCTISLYNLLHTVQSLIACQDGIWASARISTGGKLLKLVVVTLGKIPHKGGAKLLYL